MKLAIVGAGLTSAVIARLAAEDGHHLTIYEKRNHIGGNCFDQAEYNSYTHKYGPHLFHTSDTRVIAFLQRFSDFAPYFHKVTARIDGEYVPLPFSLRTLEYTHPKRLATSLTEKLISTYGSNRQTSILNLLRSNDSEIKELGSFIYEKVFLGYSQKQWGVEDPLNLDRGVLDRIPVRTNFNTDYFVDKYQCLPSRGYTEMVAEIFAHPNIDVLTSVTVHAQELYISCKHKTPSINGDKFDHVFYTGMPDLLLGCSYGSLPYRSLYFKKNVVDTSEAQSLQTNFPSNFDFTRIVDYSFIGRCLGRSPSQKVMVEEYPGQLYSSERFTEAYYPLFVKEARELYSQYQKELTLCQDYLTICGRLGDYKYYDMDDAIIAAMGKCKAFKDR